MCWIEYKDYYKILGVHRKSTEQEIKSAYRKLARTHHPDLHTDGKKTTAEERFKEINEAYQVLNDPEKRARYDELDPSGQSPKRWDREKGVRDVRGFTWTGKDARGFSFGSKDADGFSDFFDAIFGRSAGAKGYTGNFAQNTKMRGQDLEAEIALSVEEAYRGGKKKFQFSMGERCPSCGGAGTMEGSICPVCGGTGSRVVSRTLDVKITPGIREGGRIRLRGQGGQGVAGAGPGDLLLQVRLLPHPVFRLNGDDVEAKVGITPDVAVLGGKATATTLDGEVAVTVPPMSHSGRKLRLRGKGWPRKAGRGDHYAELVIDIPDALSEKEKEAYGRIAGLREEQS